MEDKRKQTFLIANLKIPVKTHYRPIRNPRLEFKMGELNLILPHGFHDPHNLINRHKKWIYRQAQARHEALTDPIKKTINKTRSEKEFHDLVFSSINLFSKRNGPYPLKVNFRKMTTRWGSCNSETKKITLNTYLKYLPDPVIQYVIFHELTHFFKRKHDTEFWEVIAQEFPEYKTLRKNLVKYWHILQHEERNGAL